MNSRLFIPLLFVAMLACSQHQSATEKAMPPNSNDRKVGGSCEGCEAIYECPVPFDQLTDSDTLPDFNEAGPALVISGTIFKADGKTPAGDVVLYIYHTNQHGRYETKNKDAKGWEKRHGSIRGWVKTNEKGQYTFYTLRPASYPNSNAPQHMHPVIKEPGCSEYYIDEFLFDDDPNLIEKERASQEERGGNGIMKLTAKNGILYGNRDIILGKNIPGYTK
jgi:protocatechuate 3,4-dioxygenase beta subunit